jgi:hypothetical protein
MAHHAATKYTVYPDRWDEATNTDKYHWTLTVEQRDPEKDLWAVTDRFECLRADGTSEYEPLPSGREDDFLARTRFPLEEALEIAYKHVGKAVINGRTFDGLIQWCKDNKIGKYGL